MAAIARRTLFALLFVNTEDELRTVLADMATELSAGNVSAFFRHIAKQLPGRDELRQQITGLLAIYSLSCSIQIQSASGTAERQTASVDWYLSGRSNTDNSVTLQRREVLTMHFIRQDKRWQVSGFTPANFFNS